MVNSPSQLQYLQICTDHQWPTYSVHPTHPTTTAVEVMGLQQACRHTQQDFDFSFPYQSTCYEPEKCIQIAQVSVKGAYSRDASAAEKRIK
jgi:hypothetical protein